MAIPDYDQNTKRALEYCAAEPVRSVGHVQPFAAILVIDQDMKVVAASENLTEITGLDPTSAQGQSISALLGNEIGHALRNALAEQPIPICRVAIGRFDTQHTTCAVHACISAGPTTIEIEPYDPDELTPFEGLGVSSIVRAMRDKSSVLPLLEQAVAVLRNVTGFDRVLAYRFDQDYNGEVVAEMKGRGSQSYLGLHFPHWDIPPQARAVMLEVPLRVIADVDLPACAIHGQNADDGLFDLTQAHCRSVSPIHLEYLRNMGVKSSMTISLVVDGALWGLISFHHPRPRLLSIKMRALLEEFSLFFNAKLSSLVHQDSLRLIDQIEAVKTSLLEEVEADLDLEETYEAIGPVLLNAFGVEGLASLSGSQSFQMGHVPGQAVLDRLLQLGNNEPDQVASISNLSKVYPELVEDLHGVAGALVASTSRDRAIVLFRTRKKSPIRWAGDTAAQLAGTNVTSRFEPRGSLQAYLEEVQGKCDPWTDQELLLAKRLWPIVITAERQALSNTITRQQNIMIDELNHRVRNILSLVRAVSQQARQRYGSLDSYAKSLEARIQALATAHGIGHGTGASAVSVQSIFNVEIGPFLDAETHRITLTGANPSLLPEHAPIFGLLVHELVTNAAKYGALSIEGGIVEVGFDQTPDGLEITWSERGGPTVTKPESVGFGTVLIEQAVAHELGGQSKLYYEPDGLRAVLTLPRPILKETRQSSDWASTELLTPTPDTGTHKPLEGEVLLVEDNFLIARNMADELLGLDFDNVEILSNVDDALEYLRHSKPKIAILDVNLGKGKTSLPIAHRLTEMSTPFIFTTGYGETWGSGEFDHIPKLTKPVTGADLHKAILEEIG